MTENKICRDCDESDPAKLHTSTVTVGTTTLSRTLCGPCIYANYL